MALYRLVVRLVLIPIGYVCGAGAAALVLVSAVWLPYLQTARVQHDGMFTVFGILLEAGFAFSFAGSGAFLPSLAAIAVAEAFSIRSFFYYVFAGAAAPVVATLVADPARAALYSGEAMVAAGLLGASVYWLVAGRGAGLRDRLERTEIVHEPRRS